MKSDRTIIGIDPGTNILGFGIISISGNKPEYISSGIIDMRKISDHNLKLEKIYNSIIKILDKFHPEELSIEAPFYGKNVQSMLKLGRAQGVVLGAAFSRSLKVAEYAPRKIKMAVTGNGNASKEQVALMLTKFFKLKSVPEPLDATDAIAVALCHYFQKDIKYDDKGAKTWKEFIRMNPKRVK